MDWLNTDIYDKKNKKIEFNNNFDIKEKNTWPSEERLNQTLNNFKEKNIQKKNEMNQIKNLKSQLNWLSLQEEFISLQPYIFDQDPKKWWRKISEAPDNIKKFLITDGEYTEWFEQAIFIMEYYLKHHTFNNETSDIIYNYNIRFHIWQQYAMIWEYDKALIWFNGIKDDWCTNFWKEYLDATIAFLQKDTAKLKNIYEQDGIDVINRRFIEYLYKYSDMKYSEAYSGWMSLNDMYKYISANMKK